MKTNKFKFNKFVKKVYCDSEHNTKYIISQRTLDGMLKITTIDLKTKSANKLIKFRKDEDFFYYYDLFEKGEWNTNKKKKPQRLIMSYVTKQEMKKQKMARKALKKQKKESLRKEHDHIQVIRF